MFVRVEIKPCDIEEAENVLVENGIDEENVEEVLQAVGYALLGEELYP